MDAFGRSAMTLATSDPDSGVPGPKLHEALLGRIPNLLVPSLGTRRTNFHVVLFYVENYIFQKNINKFQGQNHSCQ